MHDEKWQNLISMIEEKFPIEEQGEEEIAAEGGGKIEFIVFTGPLGRMKAERTTRPLVIDKKTQYSNRIGGDVKVDFVFSPTEKVHKFKVYKWDDLDFSWAEINTTGEFKI
jgi:hypothetical protein